MKITEMLLTDEELNRAVTDLLGARGIKIKIKSISEHGYPRKGWDITADCEIEDAPPSTKFVAPLESIPLESVASPAKPDSLVNLEEQLKKEGF